MAIKYKYTATPHFFDDKRIIKRPLVELEIIMNGRSLKARGLIDSGADEIIMNAEYAHHFGIDLDDQKKHKIIGINGIINECYSADISLKVEGFDKLLTFPAVFIESKAVDILLGQRGFFDAFRVKFEKDHDTFELSLVAT